PSENDKLVQERVIKFLSENLQLPIIENTYLYVQGVGLDRQSNVTIKTQDGLGITTPLLQGEKHKLFPIHKHTFPDLGLLREYLRSTPVASRLALFRDVQVNYVLQDHQELLE